MSKKRPIGVFDSGLGGISIWNEINQLMPYESSVYLADSINAPYGYSTREEIIGYSVKNTEYLLSKGSKIIVVACNTATTNAIDFLRSNYDVPFIGIEPAIKPAALNTSTNTIGILATKGTLSSDLFSKTSSRFSDKVKIIERVGEGLVPLIEDGKLESKELWDLLKKYLQPMIHADVDHLVLGCSHYPFLIPLIEKILPHKIKIIDSGAAVAKQTLAILKKNRLRTSSKILGQHHFYTNKDVNILSDFLDRIVQVDYASKYENF